MKEKSPQTFDDTPPIPKFTIAKKKPKEIEPSEETKSSQPKSVAPKPKPTSKPADISSLEKTIYDGYSTQLRTDIQQRLKRFKRDREEAGHSVCTIKQFFELAIATELDAKVTAQRSVVSNPEVTKGAYSYRPFRTEIRRDLMRRIKRWKFEQEESGQKGASIKAFLEAAIISWLASKA